MNAHNNVSVYVIHYTKLAERKKYLSWALSSQNIEPIWVTEENFKNFKSENSRPRKILGLNEKLVGMDLGINSRSRTRTRRRARIEGKILFLRSYLTRTNALSTGSLPNRTILDKAWLELQRMHLTAIQDGIRSEKPWILILEDDAVPIDQAFNKIDEILKTLKPKNKWINLNSGAGLVRTRSEKRSDRYGLFEIKPPATRCAVAYLISKDLAIKFVESASRDGIPNWLPVDFYFQVLLRKFRAKSFWIEPVLFEQGSETGEFKSGFEKFR